jgi:NADH-quinone oxidoreductase subunit E
MSAEELEGIATFYTLIFRRPVGEKVILLCDSVTCWIKGYEKIQQQITEKLGVELGETTTDQRYTLLPMTCLGACDKAPVMMIGDDLHENLDAHSVLELFNERP